MSKLTMWPWEVVDGKTTGKLVVAPDAPKVRRNVAAVGGPNREANARLIAAAPDYCDFAYAFLAFVDRNDLDDVDFGRALRSSGLIERLRAAHARARGEAA